MEENREDRRTDEPKKKSRVPTWWRSALLVFFAGVLAAAVAAVILTGSGSGIQLPEGSGGAADHVTESQSYQLSDTDITTENVQRVIASLQRPEAYTATVSNTLYWSGDWQEIKIMQYVRDGVSLTEYYNSTTAESYEAVKDDMYYAWRRGVGTYSVGKLGALTSDDTSMIPTYETVIDADTDTITAAGIRTVNSESCIYVTTEDKETDYSLTYWVSAVSGLLVQADYTRAGELVRSVTVSEITQGEPHAALFLLPDGSSLLETPGQVTGGVQTTDTTAAAAAVG